MVVLKTAKRASRIRWRCSQITVYLLSVIALISLGACNEVPTNKSKTGQAQSHIEINDSRIPVFRTAEEQLNYTRSWFADIGEKRAALQAFIRLFPNEKLSCGMAALDLAYLQLGNDYRFSYEHASFAAIKAYKDVIEQYPSYPQILAKANWYLGWIYADLLGDGQKGIGYYKEVVSKYPGEQVSLLPPAPWVSIIYPNDDTMNTALYNPPINTWAALALVEIIRHSEDGELAWISFEKLWKEYRDNVAVGFGLRLILKRKIHLNEAVPMAKEYMEKEFSNVHMLGDIQKLINETTLIEGSG